MENIYKKLFSSIGQKEELEETAELLTPIIENAVKEFVLDQTKHLKGKSFEDRMKARGVAFGAVQFSINYLFPEFNKKLGDWWQNEAYELF